MKYWETFFMTVGAGLFVGVVITPQSWLAVPLGIMASMVGFVLHLWRKEAQNERGHD